MKLLITLKQSDAIGIGGDILKTLGMQPAHRDPKSFVKELALTELLDKFNKAVDGEEEEADEEEDDDGEEVSAGSGAFTGRRRRRRRKLKPTDFLLYEDNSMYALPYLEPLTDRGIRPLRVSLSTDSTVALTPINASASDTSSEEEKLMIEAMELAKQALEENNTDPAVVRALRAAARALLEK